MIWCRDLVFMWICMTLGLGVWTLILVGYLGVIDVLGFMYS